MGCSLMITGEVDAEACLGLVKCFMTKHSRVYTDLAPLGHFIGFMKFQGFLKALKSPVAVRGNRLLTMAGEHSLLYAAFWVCKVLLPMSSLLPF